MCIRIPNYTLILELPWWCRGYHVGLSSPRLGFKSRPGRCIYIICRARSSVWQSAWLLTKWPRVQFPSGPFFNSMQQCCNLQITQNCCFGAQTRSVCKLIFAIFNWRIKCEKRYLKTQISSRTYYFVEI